MIRGAKLLTVLLLSVSPANAEVQRFSDVVQAIEKSGPTRPTGMADHSPLRVQVSYQLQEIADRSASLDAQKDSLQAACSPVSRHRTGMRRDLAGVRR